MTNDLQSQADNVASGLLETIEKINGCITPNADDLRHPAKVVWYLADAYARIRAADNAPSHTNAIGFQEVGSDERDDE